MIVRRIALEEVYSHLAASFNPPSCAPDDEAACDLFYEEWHAIRHGLLTVLNGFGENDDYGQKEFCLGDTAMLSRGIGVVFTHPSIFRPEVVEAVVSYLKDLEIDYEVNIVLQEDGVGDHDLFVSRDQILAQLSDLLWQQTLPADWVHGRAS